MISKYRYCEEYCWERVLGSFCVKHPICLMLYIVLPMLIKKSVKSVVGIGFCCIFVVENIFHY